MADKKLCLRKADIGDARLLFEWANDRTVRENAFNSEPIEWDGHLCWLEKRLKDADTEIYIAMNGDVPVGQIRLEKEGSKHIIDYSIDAGYRGQGFGKCILLLVEKELDDRDIVLTGEVKNNNAASKSCFELCGYRLTEDCGDYVVFEKAVKNPLICICTHKSWNVNLAKKLSEDLSGSCKVSILTKKNELEKSFLELLKPEYIFFPHWSYIIPEEIYNNYECVVFHMTDLPFGRGGSPLQNLIVRGFEKTMISALRVEKGLDTGNIYLKEPLELYGSAEDILKRCSRIIFSKMIPFIMEQRPRPVPQSGEIVEFKRRKPEDGKLLPEMPTKKIYDYIRMLDGEGYPPAFMEWGPYRLEFTEAELENGELSAKVVFRKSN